MGTLNFKPRTIFCRDNLDVLRGINSGCIDLIYLDPPFNKNKVFAAPAGSDAEGAAFSDVFRAADVKGGWLESIARENAALRSYLRAAAGFAGEYNYSYLVYMAIRLLECRRALKNTGSVYLHCDATMSHYLKIALDCIFGGGNFRREIIWRPQRVSGFKTRARNWIRNHDVILYYAKGARFTFHKQYEEYDRAYTGHMRGKGKGMACESVWLINGLQTQSVSNREGVGYPTQKPLALLERIIRASSSAGDMVLDPFCGCATTCIAAEKLGRLWAGVDISKRAAAAAKTRILRAMKDSSPDEKAHFTAAPPKRGKGA